MERKRTCFTWQGKWGKFKDLKKVTLSGLTNSNMVKPEKFDHLYLVCQFTVPLIMQNLRQVSVLYFFILFFH